jgi:hypothetical protein
MPVYEQKRYKKDDDGSDNYVTAFTMSTSFEDVTDDLTANIPIDCANWDEMTIYLVYTPDNSGETITSRVDFSHDQTDWHPEADEVVTSADAAQLPKTRTFTSLAGTAQYVPVISVPINDRWARIMVKNSANSGIVKVNVILSKVGH